MGANGGGILQQEGYELMAAALEVYNELGSGFLEAVYQECLEREFSLRGIPWTAKPVLRIAYKTALLAQTYSPDLVVYSEIVVELKGPRRLHRSMRPN